MHKLRDIRESKFFLIVITIALLSFLLLALNSCNNNNSNPPNYISIKSNDADVCVITKNNLHELIQLLKDC